MDESVYVCFLLMQNCVKMDRKYGLRTAVAENNYQQSISLQRITKNIFIIEGMESL